MIKIHKFSWEEITRISLTLVKGVVKDQYKPDLILTIKRGGLIPATIFSHQTNIRDVEIVDIKRTLSDEVHSDKKPPKLSMPLKNSTFRNKRILIVDDIVGTGETLSFLLEQLKKINTLEVRSAVIVMNEDNYEKTPIDMRVHVDYLGRKVRGWVVFPWERPVE